MIENKRFTDVWCSETGHIGISENGIDKEFTGTEFKKWLNELSEENKQLKHNNKMLSMKMSEVYTKYRLLNEFSKDTNPNDAVKKVLSELMQITKEYR